MRKFNFLAALAAALVLTLFSCTEKASETETNGNESSQYDSAEAATSENSEADESETDADSGEVPVVTTKEKPMYDEYKPKQYDTDAERSLNITYRGNEKYSHKTEPRLITLESSDELIVADAVVTDEPYFADPSGQYDSTTAIQNAINAVHNAGGGTVYLPSGNYLITSPLVIRPFVSVIGEFYSPDSESVGETGYGTVFLADVESTDDEMPALITVEGSAGVRGLTVFYPNQDIDDIKPYPFTFYIPGLGDGGDATNYMLMTIENLTVINGYRGVLASKYNGFVNEQFYIIGLRGTFLERGLELYNCADASAVQNVHFAPDYWAGAVCGFSPVGGEAEENAEKIRSVTSSDGIAFLFSDVEWSSYSLLSADGYADGMKIIKGIRAEFNGGIYSLRLTNCVRGLNVENLDTRTGFGLGVYGGIIEGSEYAVSNKSGGTVRVTDVEVNGSFKKNEVEVMLPGIENQPDAGTRRKPYKVRNELKILTGADSSGIKDCSAELQALLDETAAEGGGVVYIPAGYYNISSPITVPDGVDLRGAGTLPMRDEMGDSLGTVIFSGYGRGTEDPENAPALFTLGSNSSLRNIRMLYNLTDVLGDYNKNGAFTTYPFMIRGTGEGVSVVNVALLSPVYGIEMKNADDYLISFVTAGAYGEAIRINSSAGGYIGFVLNNVTANYRFAFWKSPKYSSLFPNGWETNPETELESKQNSFYMAMDNLRVIRMISSEGRLEHIFSYAAKNLVVAEDSKIDAICLGRDCYWRYTVGEENAVIVCKNNSDVRVFCVQRFNGVTYTTDGTGKLTVLSRVTIGQREPNETVENGEVLRLKK